MLTAVRRRILMNIRQGKDPYETFEGSRLGGAIRSMQVWAGAAPFLAWDPKYGVLKLTDEGAKALHREDSGSRGPMLCVCGGDVVRHASALQNGRCFDCDCPTFRSATEDN